MAATVRKFMCQLCGWGRVDICMTFHTRTMAAKKFRPSFFRHFKKIGVVHSLLSL
jgi:hypothetical protein